ncbi:Hypothetical_protein [Hexamita inflata]
MNIRSTLNENNLLFQTGFKGQIGCLEIPETNPNYLLAQNIKKNWFKAKLDIVVDHKSINAYFYYDKIMTIQEFLTNPYVSFDIEQEELKEIMDDKSITDESIQLFIEIQDQNGDYLLDFNTPYIKLVRTCVNKIVVHQKKNYISIVSWMKTDLRCTSKPNLDTSLHLSAVLTDNNVTTLQQLYKSQLVIDYKENFNEVILYAISR